MAKRGRRSKLSMISVADLQGELSRRQSHLGALVREHADVARRLDAVCIEIKALGGTANGAGRRGANTGVRGGRRRRPRNESNLVDSLAKVLKGKQMSVTDVAEVAPGKLLVVYDALPYGWYDIPSADRDARNNVCGTFVEMGPR